MKHEIPSKLRLNSNHFGKLLLHLHALNHVVIDTIITHTLHSNRRHYSMRLLLCRVKYSTDGSQEGIEGATMKPFTPFLFLLDATRLRFRVHGKRSTCQAARKRSRVRSPLRAIRRCAYARDGVQPGEPVSTSTNGPVRGGTASWTGARPGPIADKAMRPSRERASGRSRSECVDVVDPVRPCWTGATVRSCACCSDCRTTMVHPHRPRRPSTVQGKEWPQLPSPRRKPSTATVDSTGGSGGAGTRSRSICSRAKVPVSRV